ncbi:dTMP kinase [Yimella lutea]
MFEGGDGCGKTTQVERAARWLSQFDGEVMLTREPGGTQLGSQIRELLLHGGHVDPRAEALLFAADRAHHVATDIRPALECGAIVVCDRYIDSSVAYQSGGRGLAEYDIEDLSAWASGDLLPDLTIVLDLDVAVADARRSARSSADRIEAEGAQWRQSIRETFLRRAARTPDRYRVVDADGAPDEVAQRVRSVRATTALNKTRELSTEELRQEQRPAAPAHSGASL